MLLTIQDKINLNHLAAMYDLKEFNQVLSSPTYFSEDLHSSLEKWDKDKAQIVRAATNFMQGISAPDAALLTRGLDEVEEILSEVFDEFGIWTQEMDDYEKSITSS